MQILLIRHGHSEGDVLDVHEGWADLALTDLGREQAKRMAKRVKEEFPPDVILASTLSRASETAKALVDEVGCPIHFTDELKERNNGIVAGVPMEEVRRRFPEPANPHEKWEGAESKLEFRLRAETVFSKIMAEYSEYNRIAIVSHGGMISMLLHAILKMPVIDDVWIATGDTGIHCIEYNEIGTLVRFLNCTKHLD